MQTMRTIVGTLLFALLSVAPAGANIDPQSDGSDGALNVTTQDKTIDLSEAVTGAWNQPGTNVGVYDPSRWAIVFKYSSVNIAAGRTVRFINHPSNAPVVWLVQGIATIAGTVNLDGESNNTTNRESVPGPGGFPGGRGTFAGSPGTAGQGPGGGPPSADNRVCAAYSGTPVPPFTGALPYGNVRILPLIGGSGAGGKTGSVHSGGAGGGAILMVVGQRLTLNGQLRAQGGSGANNAYCEGSGGAIRVIADTLAGVGSMFATGTNSISAAGFGRIRLECNTLSFASQTSPPYSLQLPLGVEGVVIWPPAPEPTIRIATVAGQAVTSDPRMNPEALVSGDVTVTSPDLVDITMVGTNIPLNATVTVRVVLGEGNAYWSVPATHTGDATNSVWSVQITALTPIRVSALQAKVVLP